MSKKSIQKIACFLMTAALIFTLIACTSQSPAENTSAPSNSTSVNNSTETKASESAASPAEIIELTATYPGLAEEFAGTMAIYQEQLQAAPELNITWIHIPPAQFWEKVNIMYSSGSEPDFTFMSEPLYTYVSKGSLLPLNDYINKSETFHLDEWASGAIDFATVDGKIYAIPKDINLWGIYFNIDLFKAAGEKTPIELYEEGNWNWDTYREAAKKLTIKDGDRTAQYGAWFPNVWSWCFAGWLYSGGVDNYNGDRESSALNSAKSKAVFKLINDMYMVDGSMPAPLITEDNTTGMSFDTGKVAMMDNGTYMVASYAQLPFDWDFVPMPTPADGSVNKNMSYVHNSGYSISASTKHPDECWKAIELITALPAQLGINRLSGALPATFEGMANVNPPERPAHFSLLQDMLAVGKPYVFSATFSEEGDVVKKYVEQAASGTITSDEACDRMAEEINTILNSSK